MIGFALPDLGEGLTEAELVAWHVAEGDHVVADQPLVSVETEKAVVEIPSPRSGRVARLLAKPGDRIKVGAPIAVFENGDHADAGTVVGTLEEGPRAVSSGAGVDRSPVSPEPVRAPAAPGIRTLARERGVDLARLRGSGPSGAITRDDVESAARSAGTAAAAEPLRGVRRAMARNMERAHASVTPATVWDDADVEGWWAHHADVGVRLIRAIAVACAAVPALNAWYDDKATAREIQQRVDLGIAVETADGLIVPVLRDVGNRSADRLRRELDALKAATRARRVAPDELRDPTITLSNFGVIAGRYAALVVLPPQVAIVGAGRVTLQAVRHGEGVAFRHMLPLSLTFDHRAATGGEAARFLQAMIDDLQRKA